MMVFEYYCSMLLQLLYRTDGTVPRGTRTYRGTSTILLLLVHVPVPGTVLVYNSTTAPVPVPTERLQV